MSSRGVHLSVAVALFCALSALGASSAEPSPSLEAHLHRHSTPVWGPLFMGEQTALTGSELISKRDGLRLSSHRPGTVAWEPTVGVTADGDIYVTAWESTASTRVFASRDRGRTWDDVSPSVSEMRTHAVSQDPYLFTDGNRVFNLDAYALTCGHMSSTDDGGSLWTSNPVACGTVVSDHPSAFAGPPVHSSTVGYPNLIYVCDFRPFGLRSSVYCSKSANGGLSFLPTGETAFPISGTSRCTALPGHGTAGPDGAIYIPRVTPCGPELAVSVDEGDTWRQANLPQGPGTSGDHEASVAVDRKGNVFYMWIGSDRRPYLTVSTDGAKTFSRPRRVSPRSVKEANAPALAVNKDGALALIYVGSTNSPALTEERPQPCSNTATECPASEAYRDVTWNGYVTVAADPLSAHPRFETRMINPADDPIDDAACGPGRCFPLGDFIDVTAAPDGTFWAAFLDGCNAGACVEFYGAELVVVEIEQT